MNYSSINPSINYNKSLPTEFSSYIEIEYEDTPAFSKYQNFRGQSKTFDESYRGGGSTLAIGGLQMENTPVSLIFFSDENMERIQKQIKIQVNNLSKGKFKLQVNQDADDLLIAMRYIYIEHSKNLPTQTVRQVKKLNEKVLEFIIPDIITNIKQSQAYLKDITTPKQMMDQPLNVNNKGRRTLPSVDTLWR